MAVPAAERKRKQRARERLRAALAEKYPSAARTPDILNFLQLVQRDTHPSPERINRVMIALNELQDRINTEQKKKHLLPMSKDDPKEPFFAAPRK